MNRWLQALYQNWIGAQDSIGGNSFEKNRKLQFSRFDLCQASRE
jgi:hypothetical protein